MTQIFSAGGDCIPVTVIQVERCIPALKKTPDKDGYQSVLVAYGVRKEKHTNKPLKGIYNKLMIEPARVLTEFRGEDVPDDLIGQQLKVDMFAEGERVNVVGVSKGRGFAGVVKRHGFAGAPASRGSHEAFRGGGSVGMHTYPGHVFRGKKMPGHMGAERVNVRNLQVARVDVERNVILIKGAVPGSNGGLVRIMESRKKKN